MNDYKELAVRYLQMNKRRTAITISGVSIAVMVLFVMLNLGWSWILHFREQLREENDYEMVLFTESREQVEQILADNRIKEAYVGSYYSRNDGQIYPNALYVNTVNPYRIDSIFEELTGDYAVEGEKNFQLAITYFNGESDANLFVIAVLFLLLIAYIFAIFGIGIIRNSIQLSTLEQIRDYGNLRCIGASKGQLKAFVYLEGAIMVVSGMAVGIFLGTGVSMIAGYFLKMKAGFHFIPLIPIAIAFFGDLYFAMGENCKVITHMTPISVVRGDYRIREEKLKVRKSRIFGKLFGIEGDYAYKNIMRSPGRFLKTVSAMGIGIAALIVGGGLSENIKSGIDLLADQYMYYQMYFESVGQYWNTAEEIQADLPPMENMEGLANAKGVTAAKRLYSSNLMLTDDSTLYHYAEEYGETVYGRWASNVIARKEEEKKSVEEIHPGLAMLCAQMVCYGYDEEDYARYKKWLTDGTLDISDHGIVLVNGGICAKAEEDTESMGTDYMDVTFTDYKVGDTVKIVDMEKLKENVAKQVDALEREVEKQQKEKKEKTTADSEMAQGGFAEEETADSAEAEQSDTLYTERRDITYACWQELIKNGDYETYTIEGIVSRDANHYTIEPCFVLPLEHYYALTGTSESENNGMQYHIEKYPANENLEKYNYYTYVSDGWCNTSDYAEVMEMITHMKQMIYVGVICILFIVSMSSFNIINTTASNLHLRRKEFAQLRVVGISKKRLTNIVLLEGIITAIVANIFGIILGFGIGGTFSWFVYTLTGIKYRVPVLSILAGIVLSFALLCGSIYFPLKSLRQDMAADLVASGE